MYPTASAMPPWIAGRIPPPQTIVMKIPAAAGVYLPNPSTARLNILPHIIEVQRPTNTKNSALIGTSAKPNERAPSADLCNTGSSTRLVVDEKIAARTSTNPTIERELSIVLLDTLLPSDAPTKRPINIRNQYVPVTNPPIVHLQMASLQASTT